MLRQARPVMFIMVFVLVSLVVAPASLAAEPSRNAVFLEWIALFRDEALHRGIPEETLAEAFSGVRFLERVIEHDRSQPETRLRLTDYLDAAVPAHRIQLARNKMQLHADLLAEVASRYGVDPAYIVSLWGIESSFGANQGSYPVISALATLAFDGRRGAFFRNELHHALMMLEKRSVAPENLTGSWAGAMGHCQFIPSTYLAYAQDFDGSGHADIWNSLPDVFASIAHYLTSHGWQENRPWGYPVTLPRGFDESVIGDGVDRPISWWREKQLRQTGTDGLPDCLHEAFLVRPDTGDSRYYLVGENYRALLRWNRSHYFVVAVGILADALDGP